MSPAPQKVTFKLKGWSYRTAAPVLGVTYQYLCEVMNGHRTSRRLVARIHALPPKDSSSRAHAKASKVENRKS